MSRQRAEFYKNPVFIAIIISAMMVMVLGMVVDNSIVVIDGYLEYLGKGYEPKQAAIEGVPIEKLLTRRQSVEYLYRHNSFSPTIANNSISPQGFFPEVSNALPDPSYFVRPSSLISDIQFPT